MHRLTTLALVATMACGASTEPAQFHEVPPPPAPPPAATTVGGPIVDAFDYAPGPLPDPPWYQGNPGRLTVAAGEVGTTVTGSVLAIWRAPRWTDSEACIVFGSADPTAIRGAGVFVRWNHASTGRYQVHWFSDISGYQIKYDGVPSSQTEILDELAGVSPPSAGDTLAVQAIGDSIFGYLNGTRILAGQHSTLTLGHTGFALSTPGGATPGIITAACAGALP